MKKNIHQYKQLQYQQNEPHKRNFQVSTYWTRLYIGTFRAFRLQPGVVWLAFTNIYTEYMIYNMAL